jgi:hypothetical protein
MENWVQARAGCSLPGTFHVLREMIDNDVKAANELKRAGFTFELNAQPSGKLLVIRHHDIGGMEDTSVIVFELLPDRITVSDRGQMSTKLLFSAIPYLNEEGECLLTVGGQDLKLWQVRRKALDDLFFGS